MNNYPRKLFNYKSANDIFYENIKQCLKSCNRFQSLHLANDSKKELDASNKLCFINRSSNKA